jgi:hypothetical protein
MKSVIVFSALVCAGALVAQTRIDLRTQGKAFDFGDAASTRTTKTGTVLPVTCSTGELFFLTTAPPGTNLYGCVGTNVWSVQAPEERPASGDVAGAIEDLKVLKLQGRPVSAQTPANGQALMWNADTGQWQPSEIVTGGAVSSVAGKVGVVTIAASDLADCKVTRDSATTLKVTDCRVKFPNKESVVLSPATIESTGGQGTSLVYLTPSGDVMVGHSGSLTIECTGCTDAGGMTTFPPDVKPLWTFATNNPGEWAAGNGIDERGTEPTLLEPGAGILIATTNGTKTIAADTAVLQTRASAQAGQEIFCAGSASTIATCSLTPTLTGYIAGMRLNFLTAATNATTMSLNVDSLGAREILKQDGSALAAEDIHSGRYYMLTYDGTAFRLPAAGTAATQPVVTQPSTPTTSLYSLTLTSRAAVAIPPSVYGDIYSANVPALGAGKCYDIAFSAVHAGPGAIVTRLNIGGATYTLHGSSSSTVLRHYGQRFCNAQGVQNSQELLQYHFVNGTGFGDMTGNFNSGVNPGLAAIDTSVPFTIKVQATSGAASDTLAIKSLVIREL